MNFLHALLLRLGGALGQMSFVTPCTSLLMFIEMAFPKNSSLSWRTSVFFLQQIAAVVFVAGPGALDQERWRLPIELKCAPPIA